MASKKAEFKNELKWKRAAKMQKLANGLVEASSDSKKCAGNTT